MNKEKSWGRRRGSSSVSSSPTLPTFTMPSEYPYPRKPTHVELDMKLFTPSLLRDEISIECALSALEGYLQSSAAGIEQVVRALMGSPHLFEFIFSVLSSDQARSLESVIMSNFPAEAKLFDESLASAMLSNLSLYFWSLSYPSPNLVECHSAVDLARPAIKALSNTDAFLDDDSQTVEELTVAMEDEDFFVKKRQTQKQRKKNSRAQRPVVSIDSKPFAQLGVPVPLTRSDARRQAENLLQDQKRILMHYLETLRKHELASLYKEAYIPTCVETDQSSIDADKSTVSVAASELQSEIPAAYPLVQPMKAAFHFDSVDGFGEWRILVSSRADRNLREAKKSGQKLFNIILKKIKELSNGHFSDDNQKKLTGKDVGVPIFEAKMTRDTRLVYQVDCVREFETEIDRQVIRIFGIYTHAQLERGFWDAVGQHLAGKGKEYRKRCIYRKPPKTPGDNVFLPESFPPTAGPDVPESPVELPNVRDEDREELHSLLVLQKFVDFSQALLNSILADQDVQHVFHMSPAEQAIVKHSGSCYVLGRSGTGKTTTMLFKILGLERAWQHARDSTDSNIARPRQVFVTQSRVLAEKVEEYYKKLAESHIAGARTAEESAQLGANKENPEDRALVDQDEEDIWHGSLPKKFSELGDDHFPLFVTFDHLCRLLEGDFRGVDKLQFALSSSDAADDESVDPTLVASDYMLQRRESFVSYGSFLQAYWPHLPQNFTKALDPALVFAEIMGVIKGSEDALKSEDGFLDEKTYVNLSHRQQGTFANRREAVYSVFLSYLRLKRERRHWDAADRTRAILRGLGIVGVPGQKLDFVYIDEAQDNLLIDAFVIRKLCKNPDGLFWAGDTAQTISVGSSFRFDDLKAFLYRLEAASAIHGSSMKSPESFQLTINYRSHGGIVGCAHSVVQLITKFWPHAIDSLAEEKGVVDGLKPIFFSGWDQDTVQYEQFLFGASGSQIEFGAQQCILVRDDEARSKLQAQMGDIGLILTLYESKGLEFNDVLLYNFFEDSTVDVSQWRVILNALSGKKQIKCPTFDETRHSGVCRELKFLYVAITRARKNLWIADCSDKGEPLRMFWTAHNLVKNCSAADEVPRLAMSSRPEEWAATARTLFDNRRYLQAKRCYERANLHRESAVAYAYYLREQARGTARTRKTTDNVRIISFIAAAEAFLRSASQTSTRKESVAYYRNAAECFIEADEDRRAADAYLCAEEFTRSAQFYRKAGSFDEAVHVVQTHRQRIAEVDAETILDVAKLHYMRENRLDRATNLFGSLDDALEFMEDYGFEVARASLLESSGRLSEAAELHLLEGRLVKAIQLFIQDQDSKISYQRAQECVLHGLWQHLSFSTTPREGSEKQVLEPLLKFAKEIMANSRGVLTSHVRDQFVMFQSIAIGETTKLQELGERFVSVHRDIAAGLLCLDRVFWGQPVKIQSASVSEAVPLLAGFLCYVRELQRVALEQQPTLNTAFRRLFGFRALDGMENMFLLPVETFLFRTWRRRQGNTFTQDDDQPLTLNGSELTILLQTALRDRLKRSVTDENFLCAKARSIFPCPTMAVFGACYSRDCTGAHWNETAPNHLLEYSLRVRLIFQQILIYQTAGILENRKTLAVQRRFWLSTLYHTLYPVHYKLGVASLLDLKSIPESEKAIQVIKDWVRDSIYNISPWPWAEQRPHFLTDITELLVLAYAFDRVDAQHYIPRAKCIADAGQWPRDLMRGNQKDQYIVFDLIHAIDGSNDTAISAGVLFLHAVIKGQLDMDINVVCQLFEWICALFAFSQRLQRFGNLHDMTLTRRWVLSLCKERPQKALDTKLLPMFLQPLGSLLIEVYGSGKLGNYLSYKQSRRIDSQLRNIFVSRICRSLCLLGYNISDHKIRYDIHRTIILIRQTAKTYPRIFSRYLRARGWDDQVRAFRGSATEENSELDELIQLKDSSKVSQPLRPYRGVRFVQYNEPSDIIPVMNGEEAKSAPRSKLRPEAAPFIPTRLQAPDLSLDEDGDEVDSDDDDEPTDAQPEEDAGIDHTVDLDAAARTVDEAHAEQVFTPPTEAEIRAAQLISTLYRRQRSRRQGKPKKGLPEARSRWFIACQNKSEGITKHYRCYYLGPLPHAMVVVEKLWAHSIAVKKKAHLRMNIARDAELEKVKDEVDAAIKHARATTELKKVLDPSSELHRRGSIEELKKHIIMLEQLSAIVPSNVSQEWEWDLHTALKGIVQERTPPKKQLKPELVVDDDDDAYFD